MNHHVIEVRQLKKTLGGQRVLHNVNLSVNRGEILVIIGRSGSGKSVLMRHFIGLHKPDSGDVLVEGHVINRLPERALNAVRLNFGMLFQDAALFDSLNVFENVAFALREHTKKTKHQIQQRVTECLRQVGLENIDTQFPETLSGGMRKRVGLARAIAMAPSIMLYDEPTSGLDRLTGQGINRLILDLNAALGVTSVVVTHDIESARAIASRIALLDEGVIKAVGTAKELLNLKDPVVRAFLSDAPTKNGVT